MNRTRTLFYSLTAVNLEKIFSVLFLFQILSNFNVFCCRFQCIPQNGLTLFNCSVLSLQQQKNDYVQFYKQNRNDNAVLFYWIDWMKRKLQECTGQFAIFQLEFFLYTQLLYFV